KYPHVKDFANCDIEDLEKMIYSTGFYKNKTKNIKAAAEMVVGDFGGKVPSTMEELLEIPGVARKTANVILHSGFGRCEGVVVDTHVIRLSGKFKWVPRKYVESKNAVKIEQELMKLVSKKDWGKLSHLLIFHGRNTCIARRPKCKECPLSQICPSSEV
ncbi:endonuclease III, partial [Candidatus Peregrinibacteria bacterium]|nr:endonuclease III [Candidatus Peregrinibacteria bacterium]